MAKLKYPEWAYDTQDKDKKHLHPDARIGYIPASRPMLSGSNIPVSSEPGERNIWRSPLPRRTGFRTKLWKEVGMRKLKFISKIQKIY